MGDYFVVYCIVMFEALCCWLFVKGAMVCRCSRYHAHTQFICVLPWYSTLWIRRENNLNYHKSWYILIHSNTFLLLPHTHRPRLLAWVEMQMEWWRCGGSIQNWPHRVAMRLTNWTPLHLRHCPILLCDLFSIFSPFSFICPSSRSLIALFV